MSAVIALKPSEPLSPARDAPRAAIRDLAAARDALDEAEDPCRLLTSKIAERDHAVRQLAAAREDDELTLGNWLAAPDGDRPEFPSVATSALAARCTGRRPVWRREHSGKIAADLARTAACCNRSGHGRRAAARRDARTRVGRRDLRGGSR
jgi:hypothetical protein